MCFPEASRKEFSMSYRRRKGGCTYFSSYIGHLTGANQICTLSFTGTEVILCYIIFFLSHYFLEFPEPNIFSKWYKKEVAHLKSAILIDH